MYFELTSHFQKGAKQIVFAFIIRKSEGLELRD